MGEHGRTSRVTIRNHKLAINADKFICIPYSLEKHRYEALGVFRGTITSHNLGRVGDVRLVIKRSSGPIPTAREHQFETDAIKAIGIKVSLVRQEVTEERAFGSSGIIQTIKAQSGLTKKLLGVVRGHVPVGLWDVRNWVGKVALKGVTRNHSEIFRERFNNGLASVGIKEIVSDACKRWHTGMG